MSGRLENLVDFKDGATPEERIAKGLPPGRGPVNARKGNFHSAPETLVEVDAGGVPRSPGRIRRKVEENSATWDEPLPPELTPAEANHVNDSLGPTFLKELNNDQE